MFYPRLQSFIRCSEQNCVLKKHYHGNKKYMALRTKRGAGQPKNVFASVPTLHALKRGEQYAVRYTDKYGVRSDKFVPKGKLPAPRWHWDYDLTDENKSFLKEISNDGNIEMLQQARQSPLKDSDWPVLPWQPGSKRCGAVGIKLGVHPIWFKDGTYANCTLIQIQDCHVIKYFSKEEYNTKTAAVIIGGKNASPFYKNEKYHEFCREAGVPVKAKCFRFLISENAALKPGTEITAMHFKPGQFVDCTAQSIGYGFQGVIQRWHFAGGHARKDKKWMRRPGSIGGSQIGWVMKGKKMAGQLGGTNEITRGLKVLRINTRYNVLYVKGRIAGHINQFVKIADSSLYKYQPQSEEEKDKLIGPFPRYIPEFSDEELPEELYDDNVLSLNSLPIVS
uniref:Large ribosomal subunit protein uL3m n=1 Tax=Ciona intestinalis TaxID=7719 RepID=F6XR12_CIOIN|nr:39S ribosomal protein L3, mitochondrial-like [Ciona intestinalis]|eukprot:XP_002125651.1 39S ribosomal protein L3, mitochondrial-like [Ciona intestinalis]